MTDTGLPHLPGVATVSQILSALEADYTELKSSRPRPNHCATLHLRSAIRQQDRRFRLSTHPNLGNLARNPG